MSAKRGNRRNDPNAERAWQRDRAIARLARLTTATAVAGTVAVVGFGGLAAVTYSGAPSVPADELARDDTGTTPLGDDQPITNQPTVPGVSGSISQGGSSASGSQSTTPRATLQPSTRQYTYIQPPTRSTRRGHSSSGGS